MVIRVFLIIYNGLEMILNDGENKNTSADHQYIYFPQLFLLDLLERMPTIALLHL
ncbi:hypothetical protein [Bacillus changyiensis]|uniref:hypothetical protein n=1 Tax=Bacillus changyiensis TaxID=3004103 RepID=UPI0022E554D7|nr:hypothetical protein [Bacillus changyiensis]MDA1476977.1 hypothetical protein [Bacillus changyiensis]